jgi:hypothetical protein
LLWDSGSRVLSVALGRSDDFASGRTLIDNFGARVANGGTNTGSCIAATGSRQRRRLGGAALGRAAEHGFDSSTARID